METNTDRLYSISQASQELAKSESTIKAYKTLVLEAFQQDTSLVTAPNGSLTEYGLEQLKKAGRFIQKGDRTGYIKAVFQSNPSLEYPLTDPSQPAQAASGNSDYTGIQRGGALIRRRPTAIATTFSEFDQAAADGELALIQEDIATQVENLDSLFSRYAKARVQKAFTEIDHTVEAFKSNALAEMGVVAANPKEQAAHNNKEVT